MEGVLLPQNVFSVCCWVYDGQGFRMVDGLRLLTDDTIQIAKQRISQYLNVATSSICLFFGPPTISDSFVAVNAVASTGVSVNGEGREDLNMIDAIDSLTHPVSSTQIICNMLDIDMYEKTTILCEHPNFSRTLLIIIGSVTNHPLYWPKRMLHAPMDTIEQVISQNLKYEACSLKQTPTEIQDIKESLELRCVVEFSPLKKKNHTPEYTFPRVKLSSRVPFAMCRSVIADNDCEIQIYLPASDLCKRYWPFWNLRCNRSIRPSGILFRVFPQSDLQISYAIEWLPNGVYRVTIEQYSIPIDNIPINLDEELMDICRKVYETLTGDMSNTAEGKFSDVRICYFAFAGVTDIRKLVHEEIRENLFRSNEANPNDSVTKNVTLYYEPIAIRNEAQRTRPVIQCNIIRNSANSIMCRSISRANGVSLLLNLHAVAAMRLMIVKMLPGEMTQSYSKLGIDKIDPELYNSVKNSALSRKTWSCKEEATNCHRVRSVVAVNPKSKRDMDRYNLAVESGPLLMYRGFYYGACDDEINNGDKIRELRNTPSQQQSKKKKLHAKLIFFGLPVLKSIDEQKYRTSGYEGEDFRYFPACIRYQHGMKMPQRYLASMAPLYRKGLIDYIGHDADNIVNQLKAFADKASVGPKYIMKANKKLGPGEYGEMPIGVLKEYMAKIADKCVDGDDDTDELRILRRGVFQDHNRFHSILHALFDAAEDENYVDFNSNERQNFVQEMARSGLLGNFNYSFFFFPFY